MSGEIRLRGEWDGRTAAAGDDAATLSRVRLGARAELRPWLSAFVQLQDARAWGTETNTAADGTADQLDLHQGYVDLRALGLTARLGRQELALSDERLVGPLLWANTTRTFDGAVFGHEHARGEVRLFWMNVAERDALIAVGVDPQANEGDDQDGWFMGGFLAHRLGASARAEVMFLHDRNAVTDKSYTAWGRFYGRAGDILYDGSGAYQFGADREAFQASGRLGLAVGPRGSLALQLDVLSGDADTLDATRKAFASLYGTGHLFHGYMDYFLDFPRQTVQAGLIDAIARLVAPVPQPWTLLADLHYFALAAERNGQRGLGVEGDVILGRALVPGATVEAGGSVFVPRDLVGTILPAFAGGTDDPTYWGYVMLTVRFPQ
ncbi:MAG TPA: alginate export family protein [Gemmatimonadales bacterium]|nr:alginate export family protein [Gemmatimonadales bacterium]